MMSLPQEEKIEWAKSWITSRKPKYKLQNRAGRLTRIANGLFADHRCQSLPFPDDTDIASEFKGFWPKSTWNPASASKIKQMKFPCRADFVAQELSRIWSTRAAATPVRDKVWITARAGRSLETDITSLNTISSARTTFINNITKSNTNVNHILGGYPLVERIMFVQQTNSGSYEAWEWNYQSEEFDKII